MRTPDRPTPTSARKNPHPLLAVLFEHAGPTLALDADGVCLFANQAATALSPDPSRPLAGDDAAARLPLLADPAVVAAIADTRLGRPGQAEVAAPGGARWFAVRAVSADPLVLVYLEETSARHAAEDAADAASEQARLSGLAGSTGAFISNLVDSTIRLSEQARRIAGFEATPDSRYPRSSIEDHVHPADLPRYRAAIASVVANPGAVYDVTYRLIRPDDGRERTLHVVGEVLSDPDGRPAAMIGSIADVTDRSAAEEALRVSEERLRRTIEGVDAIISFREDGQSDVIQSAQVERILGYSPGQMTDLTAWNALIHPDDLDGCLAAWQDEEWNLAYRLRRADGQYVWLEDRGRWIDRGEGRGLGLIGVITDISARKRVEEELRASEERLRRTIEGVDAVITYRGSSSGPTVQSPQVERILGYPPAALLTEEAWFELVHPEDRGRIGPWCRQTTTWMLTYRLRRADGTWIWVDDRGQRFTLDDGSDTGYVGMVVDVTDRVEAGHARRMADERRRRFFDANIVGTVVAEADGLVLEANDYWLRLVGHAREELERGELDWRAVTAPESIEEDEGGIAQCRATGSSRPYEKVYLRPDGTRVPALVVHASMPGPGEQVATFALDLSERNAAATEMAQLVAAIDQTSESVVVTDVVAAISYVNPAFERTTGFTRAEAIGQNPRILNSGAHGREFFRDMWQTLHRGETWQGELVNRRKDGSIFTEVAAISPVRDALGQVTAYVGVKRDVTPERELEARLSQAQRLESLGQLAGGIAHDFNNLLAVIRGYADLARAAMPTASGATEDLDQVVLAADRASSLTRQLLLFSRRQAMEPRVVNPATVIEDLAPMLRRVLGEHILLDVAPADTAAGAVRVDPGQLEQVVINLVANARDAMPDGGRLAIRIAGAEEDGQPWVRLTVADTGTGMDQATADRAFEPFFTTKEPGRGTGLGLSTVYGIVVQFGGRVSVASSLGKGSTFTIDLPRADAFAGDAPEAREAAPAEARRALSVLLVEDDPAVRSLTRRMLVALGHEVTTAASGAEALALMDVAASAPDLLVTDVRMPGIQGPELARRLRERHPSLPIVFTSGFSAELGDRLAIPGAQVLDKPFDMRRLEAATRAALGSED